MSGLYLGTAVIGGAISYGNSQNWWQDKDEDKDKDKGGGGLEVVDTMNPQQQALMGEYMPYLQSRIGQGLPAWQGDWSVPLEEGEQWGIGKYKEAVEGLDPKAVQDWYMQYVAPNEKRYMRQEVIPEIREAGIRSGNLYGSPTEDRETKAWEGYGTSQLGRIGEAITTERAGARASLPGYMQAASLPRLIEQQDLNARIQEFIRTTPELNPILGLAQNALGIQTKAAYFPTEGGGGIMDSLSPIIGDIVGNIDWGSLISSMGSGGGGAAA